jgi:hypothetical protein
MLASTKLGARFFEGVCPPNNATANFCDPPHPAVQRPEPRYWDSGLKRVTHRSTEVGDLA